MVEITNEISLRPDHIYVIPNDKNVVANDGILQLQPRTTDKHQRGFAIDLFFTSLAVVHESHAIGVVLSGTARDGTLGLNAIKEHGGITIAEENKTADHPAMPHHAADAGVVDFILPAEEIPKKILELTRFIDGQNSGEQDTEARQEDAFRKILALLRMHKGMDFTYYKQSTIRRRMLRRMALTRINEPASYLEHLNENKRELDILFQDLLIPVTSFFRDAKVFDNLCDSVFPHIIKNKVPESPIRIWIAGCSNGAEAYSIAICLKEFLGEQQEKVQIFATDISTSAIAKARSGLYTQSEVEGVPPERLQEFFQKTNGSYQVKKTIRDMCVFAVHNFLKDAPFSKVEFVSCRNVLIYMENYLQHKALTNFHYALNENGILLLGKSDGIGSAAELFISRVNDGKLFNRKNGLADLAQQQSNLPKRRWCIMI